MSTGSVPPGSGTLATHPSTTSGAADLAGETEPKSVAANPMAAKRHRARLVTAESFPSQVFLSPACSSLPGRGYGEPVTLGRAAEKVTEQVDEFAEEVAKVAEREADAYRGSEPRPLGALLGLIGAYLAFV